MKKQTIFLCFALIASIFVIACEEQSSEDRAETGSPYFQLQASEVEAALEGGPLIIPYTFTNRPEEGQFVVNLEDAEWITYDGDNAEDNLLSFSVEPNSATERTASVFVRYDYNDGVLLDTVTVIQAGKNADVFIDAKVCTGEYYLYPASGATQPCYYIWVSTLGLWTNGSEGVNLEFYAKGDPVLGDYDFHGQIYEDKLVLTLPAGTYTYSEELGVAGTFSGTSFYGISDGSYDYPTRYEIVGGEFTITHLDDTNFILDALVTCTDGKKYSVYFAGPLTECIVITTGGNPEDDDPMSKWVGTYNLTSSATIEFYYENGNVGYRKLDEPMTKQISIRESAYNGEVEIYGLSAISDETYAVGREVTSNGVTGLGIVLDEIFYDNGAEWLGIYETEDGRLGIRSGLDMGFFFVENNGVLTSTPRKGEFTSDGTVFYVIACDLFSQNADGGINLYYQEYPAHIPAGDITLEKIDDSAAVPSAASITEKTYTNIYNFTIIH